MMPATRVCDPEKDGTMKATQLLHDLGQSLWLDNITRDLLDGVTLDTMPEGTLKAFGDHGEVGDVMAADGGDAEAVLANFAKAGIDVSALATQLQDEGAKLLTGGNRLASGAYAKGWFHEPTVFGNVAPNMRIAQEEIFGPVVSVIPVDNFEHAIEVANGVPYGLSASIYTRNVNLAFAAMRDLYTGIVYVNAPTIGAETHLPFGGTKQTGNGHREAAIAAIDFFTEWKTMYIDYSDKLQRAQIDNAE